jgi:hypothetical protein
VPAEGVIAFCEQLQACFLESSWVFEQPASLPDTNRISHERTEHPGGHRRGEHDAQIEPTFSGQRARRDQRCIAGARHAGAQNRDEHEQDDVFGQIHGYGASVIMGSLSAPGSVTGQCLW